MSKIEMGGPRFQVAEGSVTGHCCFDATVVDTQRPIPHLLNVAQDEAFLYERVCECSEVQDAQWVAALLNKHGRP